MVCKICSSETELSFTHKVLKKYDVKYFRCLDCNYLFTENPYWLEEAYNSSINLSDTGILRRNIYYSKAAAILIFFYFDYRKKFLDYAGGYGIFTRLMRDIGFDFYWHDDYTQNLLARGFEMKDNNYELITAFEVFEHFENPIIEVKKILNYSDNILFSTQTISEKIPSLDWWYYGFEHGQHISFYSKKTFERMANILGLKYSCLGELHLLSKEKRININSKLLKLLALSDFYLITKLKLKGKHFTDHLLIRDQYK